eukprot:COSAG01_NODE_32532_length_579_cov_1.666667_1_plen_151_part_01
MFYTTRILHVSFSHSRSTQTHRQTDAGLQAFSVGPDDRPRLMIKLFIPRLGCCAWWLLLADAPARRPAVLDLCMHWRHFDLVHPYAHGYMYGCCWLLAAAALLPGSSTDAGLRLAGAWVDAIADMLRRRASRSHCCVHVAQGPEFLRRRLE